MAVSSLIKGRNVDLYVERSGVWVLRACATSCSMELTQELIPVATRDTGFEEDFEPGFNGCSLSFDGMITIDVLGKWQMEDDIANLRVKNHVMIKMENGLGDTLAYDMLALTTNIINTGDVEGWATYSVSMTRCGEMTKVRVINGGLVDSFGNYILDSNGSIIRA